MNASGARQTWTAAEAPFQVEMLWCTEPNHRAYETHPTQS